MMNDDGLFLPFDFSLLTRDSLPLGFLFLYQSFNLFVISMDLITKIHTFVFWATVVSSHSI